VAKTAVVARGVVLEAGTEEEKAMVAEG